MRIPTVFGLWCIFIRSPQEKCQFHCLKCWSFMLQLWSFFRFNSLFFCNDVQVQKKPHFVRVRKTSMLGGKYLLWSPETHLKSMLSSNTYHFFVSTGVFFCLLKIPSGFSLTYVEMQLQTIFTSMPAFLPVTSQPSPPPPVMKFWSSACCYFFMEMSCLSTRHIT